MYGLNDLFLEVLRALVLAGLLFYLLVRARHSRFSRLPGARLIVTGFSLLLLATLLDITDEIPGLEQYVVIGATQAEAYIETIFGYLAGFGAIFAGFVKMIPSIAKIETVGQELRESEARFRLIFESSPDPLIIARTDSGGIIDVNQAFTARTGITAEAARGRNSGELKLWADPGQRDEFLGILMREGAIFNLEAGFRMSDGEVRIGLASAQLIELGGVSCMLIDIRDITRQKQAECVLLEMDRMKSEFISTAAHELRTPLATMLGYTELILTSGEFSGFSEQQRTEFLNEIYQKGEMLSRIIDEMLDISRIESGHPIALDLQPHQPLALLHKVVHRFELQNSRHLFQLTFAENQPEALVCDLHRITQVLDNLLSNAVKYSPRGGMITVRGEASGNDYMISIGDQGIGMTPEQQARVFDKFYRADSSNTAIGGLGLGMSIARQIIEVHGGRIWLESEPGVGTTVRFTLPREQS